MKDRKINQAGLEIIKQFEGLRLIAYLCPARVWTLGFGRTKGVKSGDTCTEEQAEQWLKEDVATAEAAVNRYVEVPVTDNQFSAMVSLAFNIGNTNFKRSTLLTMLNKGWHEEASRQFMRWNKIKGEESAGLHRRRTAEYNLWHSA